ncbi:basic proline-rich protein-like [Pristis pectinata]|uniref:basic proline-rich protein-like n=1 Tax=Pristis pectinata TaxID=685728 RepID=UPI00223D2532|nr:basic proline-rich protein-like [Pristis pectinata]
MDQDGLEEQPGLQYGKLLLDGAGATQEPGRGTEAERPASFPGRAGAGAAGAPAGSGSAEMQPTAGVRDPREGRRPGTGSAEPATPRLSPAAPPGQPPPTARSQPPVSRLTGGAELPSSPRLTTHPPGSGVPLPTGHQGPAPSAIHPPEAGSLPGPGGAIAPGLPADAPGLPADAPPVSLPSPGPLPTPAGGDRSAEAPGASLPSGPAESGRAQGGSAGGSASTAPPVHVITRGPTWSPTDRAPPTRQAPPTGQAPPISQALSSDKAPPTDQAPPTDTSPSNQTTSTDQTLPSGQTHLAAVTSTESHLGSRPSVLPPTTETLPPSGPSAELVPTSAAAPSGTSTGLDSPMASDPLGDTNWIHPSWASGVGDPSEELLCDFEHGLCGWQQCETDDFDWMPHHYQMFSRKMGPKADHSKGQCKGRGGRYLYLEASFPRQCGEKAVLISPLLRGHRCLSFWYNMYGKHIGSLNVYLRYESSPHWHELWSVTGNQDRKWLKAEADVLTNGQAYRVIIEGVLGLNSQRDAAIDDLHVYRQSCAAGRKHRDSNCPRHEGKEGTSAG